MEPLVLQLVSFACFLQGPREFSEITHRGLFLRGPRRLCRKTWSPRSFRWSPLRGSLGVGESSQKLPIEVPSFEALLVCARKMEPHVFQVASLTSFLGDRGCSQTNSRDVLSFKDPPAWARTKIQPQVLHVASLASCLRGSRKSSELTP